MTDSYKVLGQNNPGAAALVDAYVVPGGAQAVISSISVAELNGDTGVTFRISIAVAGAADNSKQYLAYNAPISANDTVDFTMGITLGPGDVIRVYASTAHVSFNIWGDEISNSASPSSGQLFLGAAGMWPSQTSGCATNALVETATNKQNYWALDFADGSTLSCEATVCMPADWDGGTVSAVFHWLANDTSGNAVKWGAQARVYADGDAIDQAWGAQQTVTDNDTATANTEQASNSTGAITIGGSPGASRLVQFRFQRIGGDAADTLAATARLLGVMITYTRIS